VQVNDEVDLTAPGLERTSPRGRVDPRIPVGLYAAVLTALRAGIPHAVVLQAAGLGDDEWSLESAAWGRRVAAMLEDDSPSLQAHDLAMVEARDRLARSVEPLDSDLGAWFAFQAAWGRAPDPTSFLRDRGVTTLDMLRISARWSTKFSASEALRFEALACMAREHAPVPELRVGPWPLETAFVGLWVRDAASTSKPPEPVPLAPAEEEGPPLWTALPGKEPVTAPE
jgi:hypothetical protein